MDSEAGRSSRSPHSDERHQHKPDRRNSRSAGRRAAGSGRTSFSKFSRQRKRNGVLRGASRCRFRVRPFDWTALRADRCGRHRRAHRRATVRPLGVDGSAVRAGDAPGATERARRLVLNAEVIACGKHPRAIAVTAGTATTIATGGALPRGADAAVMVEWTDLVETPTARPSTSSKRPRRDSSSASPDRMSPAARRCCAAGTDRIARDRHAGGLRVRPGSSRGAPAAGRGLLHRRRVGGARRAAARPAAVYEGDGAMRRSLAAVTEAGGEAISFGAVYRRQELLDDTVSPSAHRLRHGGISAAVEGGRRPVGRSRLAARQTPGIIVHGVALKPGKPLCPSRSPTES